MRFCGMVLDEPRPSWNGSYTSSTSVCIISFTSSAILPHSAGDEAEEAADLGDAVAHRVPGDLGLGELELLGELDLHLEAVLAERRQRAGGAAELEHEHARAQLGEPLLVALERRPAWSPSCSRR